MARKATNPQNLQPFPKGQSGNPTGRPKKLPEIDSLLSEVFDISAMRQILTALKRKALSGDCRTAELILDRCYGKLKTVSEMSLDLSKFSDDELLQLIERLAKNEKTEGSKQG